MAGIAARLARAGGEFRRSLAQMLRDEGVRITEIGHILDVSRQRVSALLRRPSQSEQGDSSSPSPSSADAEVTPQSSGVAKVASR
jgi:predicted transcriptional regulator